MLLIRSLLVGQILTKSLRLQADSTQREVAGDLVTTDVVELSTFLSDLYQFVASLAEVVALFWSLWRRVGIASLAIFVPYASK